MATYKAPLRDIRFVLNEVLADSEPLPGDDGTITIQLGEPEKPKKPSGFEDNIADDVDPFELTRIANDLLEGIEQDDRSRSEWLQQRADGLDLLGLKIERASSGLSASRSCLPVTSPSISPVRCHSVLMRLNTALRSAASSHSWA